MEIFNIFIIENELRQKWGEGEKTENSSKMQIFTERDLRKFSFTTRETRRQRSGLKTIFDEKSFVHGELCEFNFLFSSTFPHARHDYNVYLVNYVCILKFFTEVGWVRWNADVFYEFIIFRFFILLFLKISKIYAIFSCP